MRNLKSLTPAQVWGYVPQCFIGLFFIAAAFLKSWESFFGPHRFPLSSIFDSWLTQRLGVEFYMHFMQWSMPYSDALAVVVILGQGLAGLLLVLNMQTRIAGVLILFIQTNVYLAIYHQIELRNLNTEALWIGLYFFARPEMNGRLWKLMTYALSLTMLSHLAGRLYMFADPYPSQFAWQFEIFTYTNMSSWPGLKAFVVWFFSGKHGPALWASTWWIKLILALGLLTRFRLYAGAALLLTMLMTTLVWLLTLSCEGSFWVLILFLWMTHELALQRATKEPIRSLLP